MSIDASKHTMFVKAFYVLGIVVIAALLAEMFYLELEISAAAVVLWAAAGILPLLAFPLLRGKQDDAGKWKVHTILVTASMTLLSLSMCLWVGDVYAAAVEADFLTAVNISFVLAVVFGIFALAEAACFLAYAFGGPGSVSVPRRTQSGGGRKPKSVAIVPPAGDFQEQINMVLEDIDLFIQTENNLKEGR